MSECVFCRIVRREVRSEIVDEDGEWVAFRDIDPQAPVHVLVIPREHIESVDALGADRAELGGELLRAAARVAAKEGIGGSYRVVSNVGREAGQSVFHLHLHVLGGRRMRWPPG